MEKNMSEGESDLIQIFLFNWRLPVAVGSQRYSVELKERWMAFLCWHVFNLSVLRQFKIKLYGPINCFLWYTVLKEECLTRTLRAAQGCGSDPAMSVLSGGSGGNVSPLALILWRVSSFLKEEQDLCKWLLPMLFLNSIPSNVFRYLLLLKLDNHWGLRVVTFAGRAGALCFCCAELLYLKGGMRWSRSYSAGFHRKPRCITKYSLYQS